MGIDEQLSKLLKRPVLTGGLGLATGLWVLNSLGNSLGGSASHGDGFGLTGTVAIAAGVWWLHRRSQATPNLDLPALHPSQLNRADVEQAIAQTQLTLDQLGAELAPDNQQLIPAEIFPKLHNTLAQLTAELDRQDLRLGVVGSQGVGKTTLLEVLAQQWKPESVSKLQLLDTPPLFRALTLARSTDPALESGLDWSIPQGVLEADAVLFVTAGDLADTEFRCLRWLQPQVSRLFVVLNKQDQRLPQEQALLVGRLRSHLKDILPAGDVVAIAAKPSPLTVIQPQADGSVRQEQVIQEANLALLSDRLNQLLIEEPVQPLIWQTVKTRAEQLEAEAKDWLNTLRRAKSMKVVEQYQWVSAGAAFVNPLPSLDLLATAAVSSQLILDLSKIYQQPLSVEHAKTLAIALAEMLIKLGLVEVSTQLLGTVLKTNGLTYVAGGMIQGASAAYLTRVVGLSLMDYFQELAITGEAPEPQTLERLKQALQKTFQASRQTNLVQVLAMQALQRLKPEKEFVGS